MTLRDDTEVLYMISVPYAPGFERGLRWNDPAIGIAWPTRTVGRVGARRRLSAARGLSGRGQGPGDGSGGFIGRSSLEPLRAAGYEVCAVLSARPDQRDRTGGALPDVDVRHADLTDPAVVDSLLEAVKPTHLLHFAWIATPGLYWQSEENYRWLSASRHLLAAFARCGGVRAVMAGSCAEYDWSRVAVCHERSSPLADEGGTATPYAACKIAMQRSLEEYGRSHGLSSAWGRIFFQYGPASIASD